MNDALEGTTRGVKKPILEGSFIQKLFYPTGNLPFIAKNIERSIVDTNS
jgi:hypothetical protein